MKGGNKNALADNESMITFERAGGSMGGQYILS